MAIIEETKKKLQENGTILQQASAQQTSANPQNITKQSVADAIQQAAAENQKKVQAIQSGQKQTASTQDLLPTLMENGSQNQQSAASEEPAAEDGLQRMIREAQIQTDQMIQPKGLVGGDADLAGAGQKLLQASALQNQSVGVPMEGTGGAEEEKWTDTSYLTFQPDAGITRTDKAIAEGAGNVIQDEAGESWMIQQNGGLRRVTGMSEQELAQLQKKMQDTSYQVTGRIYGLNADGSTPQWLSVGDQVVTAGGTYIITGHKAGGGYTSEVYDPNQTTATFRGNYNTGTYGSILGEQNGNADSFLGNRESNGQYTGYGGYSINRQTGQTQFDTVAHTFDGEWTRAAVVEGIPYKLDARGNLEPLEAGSLIQDASERYWVIGADGKPIDVTPADPQNNPLNDPTGEVGRIQLEEAKNAGLNINRGERSSEGSSIDPVTQAQIAQLEAQLAREKAANEAANRDLYRQYRLGQEKLSDQLVGAGLVTTGANEKAHADLTAEYLAAANANRQGMRNEEEDVAWQIQAATLQAQQEAQAKEQQEAQQRAATLAQYGDFSGYSELGYSPAQIAGMKAAYETQNAPDTTYGGLSDYTVTLLELYQANPRYDIKAGLQEALQSGLISQQDYLAGLQMASGMAV